MINLPKMIGRQNILAAYLFLGNPRPARTLLFKHLFILSKEFSLSRCYDFIPYKYGSYSVTMENDLSVLKRKGIIDIDDKLKERKFLKEYFNKIDLKDRNELINFVRKYKNILNNYNKVVEKTYQEYPYFAINSEIINRYPKAKKKVEVIRKDILKQKSSVLFTIGYEGISLEGFLNELIKNNIKHLVDVRKNSKSMKFGFSSEKLNATCKMVGIEYIPCSELGIASEFRQNLITLQDYEELFKKYKKNLHTKEDHIKKIRKLLTDNKRIALMCFEANPKMCHRTVLANYILKESKTPLVAL